MAMTSRLPWFSGFPLYLAPMAGVSDKIFRQFCKERGADVLVTEFVSAEGVFRRNERTREYLDFDECERPIGVQLFGGNAEHMAEAAKHVVDWVRPDFIDLNFGCPVNKVVAKNGGSALLKDCPALTAVAAAVVKAVAPLPVTAKIRIGWDAESVNAPRRSEEHTSELQSRSDLVCRLLLEKKKKNRLLFLSIKKKKKTK